MTIGLLFFSALRKARNGSFNLLDACALPKGKTTLCLEDCSKQICCHTKSQTMSSRQCLDTHAKLQDVVFSGLFFNLYLLMSIFRILKTPGHLLNGCSVLESWTQKRHIWVWDVESTIQIFDSQERSRTPKFIWILDELFMQPSCKVAKKHGFIAKLCSVNAYSLSCHPYSCLTWIPETNSGRQGILEVGMHFWATNNLQTRFCIQHLWSPMYPQNQYNLGLTSYKSITCHHNFRNRLLACYPLVI